MTPCHRVKLQRCNNLPFEAMQAKDTAHLRSGPKSSDLRRRHEETPRLDRGGLLLLVFALVEVRAAVAQGQQGTLTYSDGSRYQGEIHNADGTAGAPISGETAALRRPWSNDRRYGAGRAPGRTATAMKGSGATTGFRQGTYSWPNGAKYSVFGATAGNTAGESTRILTAAGTKAIGTDDMMHGQGTRTCPMAKAMWARSAMIGEPAKGPTLGPDGARYAGGWVDGKKHGQGVYTLPDGGGYEGEWFNNKRHGQGTHTWANGHRYEGTWRSGAMHGRGAFFWPDGGSYTGEWHDNRKQGRGTRIWADGRRYEGDGKMT